MRNNIHTAAILLAAADSSPGTGRTSSRRAAPANDPRDPRTGDDRREQRAHAVADKAEADAADEGEPDIETDPEAETALVTVSSRSELTAFVRGAVARGHIQAPKIVSFKEGQGVIAVFERIGSMTFAPRPEDLIMAAKLNEEAKPRTSPSIVCSTQAPDGTWLRIEFAASYGLRRPFGLRETTAQERKDGAGAWVADAISEGQEFALVRGATRKLEGKANQVTDWTVTIAAAPKAVRS